MIRDPVHGDIELSRLETAVLDCAAVQRLRGIKQLGTAYLVYPGALHTRFDHSLGACAVSHRIVAGLRQEGLEIPAELEELIGVGALLHDVTHIPFGHTLEDERRLFPRHDKGGRLARLLGGALGDELARLGIRDEVAGLLGAGTSAWPDWAREVILSTIDADLLDYLRRDSYFTGLPHNYDDRVFRSFGVAGGRLALRMARHGMDRPDARSEVIQLLRTRYFLTERVYYHHTKVVAGAMISKAVEIALDHGALAEHDLMDLDDWTLLEHLARCGVPAVAALGARLRQRRLLKRAYIVSAATIGAPRRAELVGRFHESRAERGAAEAQLASALRCPAEDVIVYCPALTVMKEAGALADTRRGPRPLNDPGDPAFAEISALEGRYANLWRLYVFTAGEAAKRAAQVAAELFGHSSEYDLPS